MNNSEVNELDAKQVRRALSRTKVALVGMERATEESYPQVDTCEYVVIDGAWTARLHNEDSHEEFCRHMEFVLEVTQVCKPEYNGNGCFHFATLSFD